MTTSTPTTTANQPLITTSVRTGSPYAQRAPGGQAENPEECTNLERSHVASPREPVWSHTKAPTASNKHSAARRSSRLVIGSECLPAPRRSRPPSLPTWLLHRDHAGGSREGDRARVKIAAISHVRRERTRMTSYAVARLDEIDEVNDGREPFRAVRHHFGITSFGVTAWTARDAGDRIINEHDESEPDSSEELYLVIGGRAVFELDGDRVRARRDVRVCASRREADGVCRGARNDRHRARRHPGKGVRARRLGTLGPAEPALRRGRVRRGGRSRTPTGRGSSAVRRVLYNLACCESLAGRTADAIDHLRRAIDRSERYRSYAKADSDFDPIRDEPGFKELIGR